MNFEDVTNLGNAAKAKSDLLKNHFGKYCVRAFMAGIFVTVAMIFWSVCNSVFRATFPEWGRFLGAAVFGIAIMLIVSIGGELFTGNNMVMAFGVYNGNVNWLEAGKVWLVSYIGNLVGCFFFSVIYVLAGAGGTQEFLVAAIPAKIALPASQMFFRGVLCNFFVCCGVLCGMKLKNEVAKFWMIGICICGFVFCGFEHSIANMGSLITALFVVPGLSVAGVIKNLVLVSLGNMVGGAIVLALPLKLMSADK